MITAAQLSTSRAFKKLCRMAEVEPTKRQAAKFLNKTGTVYDCFKKLEQREGMEPICPGRYNSRNTNCLTCPSNHDCFKVTYKELF